MNNAFLGNELENTRVRLVLGRVARVPEMESPGTVDVEGSYAVSMGLSLHVLQSLTELDESRGRHNDWACQQDPIIDCLYTHSFLRT